MWHNKIKLLLLKFLLSISGSIFAQSQLPPCQGTEISNWANCFGSITFANSNKYIGEFKDGMLNGQGTYTFVNGTKYIGEFKDGKRNGQGTFTFTNGNKFVGEHKDDKLNGQGYYSFTNGNKYVGEFKDGNYNGQGIYTFFSGNKYIGEFKDNKRNGQGTYTYANGDKYVGEHRDDKRNGQGTFIFANGDKYLGEYRDDNRNGQGTITFASGEKYVGEWRDDKYNGQGRATFVNGDKYVGQYKENNRHGQGTYTFANGNNYVGDFKNGNYYGLGTLYAANGSIINKGIWENDKFVQSESKSPPLQTSAQKSKFDGEYLFQPGIIDYKMVKGNENTAVKDKKLAQLAREFCQYVSKDVFSVANSPNALIISGSNIKFKKINPKFNISLEADGGDTTMKISPQPDGKEYYANLNNNIQNGMLRISVGSDYGNNYFAECNLIFKKISP